jgi:hypothetical protein
MKSGNSDDMNMKTGTGKDMVIIIEISRAMNQK